MGAALLAAVAGQAAWAQGGGDRRGVAIAPDLAPLTARQQDALGFNAEDSAGLFVGVRHFLDSEGKKRAIDVPYAVDDAADLAYAFANDLGLVAPHKVVLAIGGEPQKSESRERLQRLERAGARRVDARFTTVIDQIGKTRDAAGERGILVMTFATHGYTSAGTFRLLGQDSVLTELDATGVAVEKITDAASASKAPRQLVFIDACRERVNASRSLGSDARAALPERLERAIRDARGMAILCATTAGGFSYDDPELQNGVFTAAVLGGLQGGAAHDARGFITPATLAAYVDRRVRDWVERNRAADRGTRGGITFTVEELRSGNMPLAAKPRALGLEADRRSRLLAVLRAADFEELSSAVREEAAWALEQPETAALEPLLGRLEKLEALGAVYAEPFALWWDREGRIRFAPIALEIRTRDGRTSFEEGEVFGIAVNASIECCRTVIAIDGAGAGTLLFPNSHQTEARVPARYDRAILLESVPPHGTTRYIAVATRLPFRLKDITTRDIAAGFCPLPLGMETPCGLAGGDSPVRWRPLARFLAELAPLEGASRHIDVTTRRPGGG